MGRYSNRVGKNKSAQKPLSVPKDEYNLQNNYLELRKKSQRGGVNIRDDRTDNVLDPNFQEHRYKIDSSSEPNSFTGSTWSQYTHLDDRLDSYKSQNESQHETIRGEISDLRKEFAEQMDKRLSIQWYRWTIAGLVAIASLFYLFSYSDVLSTIKKFNNQADDIDKVNIRIHNIEEYIDNQSCNTVPEFTDTLNRK